MTLDAAIAAVLDDLVALRRDLHRWPEPGFEETRTQARIRAELEALGLQPRDCAGTGLVVDIGSQPVVALRADIDALRMTEENPQLPWRSERPDFAHMCGHDGHVAGMVGVARLLAPLAGRLLRGVRLLFQPAEEGPGGAPRMIEEGALDGIAEVYGMHNWPLDPLGTLRTVAGPCMATVARFTVVVRGRGSHASQPHHGKDPVLAAAHLVAALHTIVSRDISYADSVVLSVTTIHGGEAFNVIPDAVTIQGTVRALSEAAGAVVERRVGEVVRGVTSALGCGADLTFGWMYPVLVNTAAEVSHVERVGRAVLGPGAVSSQGLPLTAAEDFAYYLRERPGCFFFLGSGAPRRTNSMCHATDYDFNDDLLPVALRLWARLVEDRLGVALW